MSHHGIVHQTLAPYTPQQNGVDKKKNQTLKNLINSILITSGAPHSLWGEACLTTNMILNRIPHKRSDKSPYQLWKGKLPSYKTMKVWGTNAFTRKDKRTKGQNLDQKPLIASISVRQGTVRLIDSWSISLMWKTSIITRFWNHLRQNSLRTYSLTTKKRKNTLILGKGM